MKRRCAFITNISISHPTQAAFTTGFIAFNFTGAVLLLNNLKNAIHDGSFDRKYPDGPAKEMILNRIKGGEVTKEQWNEMQQQPPTIRKFESEPTQNQNYTSYADLASDNGIVRSQPGNFFSCAVGYKS